MASSPPAIRSVLVGTAGHVDHGKTALVRALTGIDCDRLAEEKRRGITLDLGFAHLDSEETILGFVDVPGHEHFLSNALAGLGGVRLLLLVVAADEGMKPQTIEHLEIAELLAIPRLVVAISKCDAADPATIDLLELELAERLARTPWADAAIVRVSAMTGEGVPGLANLLRREAAAIEASAAASRDQDPARLPIDRAFLLKGQGVIVTGTLVAGTISTGDELELLPTRRRLRVRSVEVHGRRRAARSGERAALQLAGVELADLERGMELAAPGALRATRRLIADLALVGQAPSALDGPTPIRLHLFAGEALGTARPLQPASLAPGGRGIVEIALDRPIPAARGDRFIVRRPSPEALLGGGSILDPFGRRARALDRSGERLARLLAGDESALLAWVEESGARGLAPAEAAARFGASAERLAADLARLATAGRLIALGPDGAARRYLAPEALARLTERAKSELADFFREQPLASGMKKAEAVRRLLPTAARSRAELFFDFLVRLGAVESIDGEIRLPGRSVATPADLSPLARAILDRFLAAGLTPESAATLTADLAPKREIVEGLVKHLVARGELTRLSSGLVLATSALEKLAHDVRTSGWERFSVPQFKERFSLSRKWAIPLLEHLDDTRVTQRLGDERRVMPARANPAR